MHTKQYSTNMHSGKLFMKGEGVVAKNFLCLSVGVFYCAPALANILVLLVQEAAVDAKWYLRFYLHL